MIKLVHTQRKPLAKNLNLLLLVPSFIFALALLFFYFNAKKGLDQNLSLRDDIKILGEKSQLDNKATDFLE
ncbi:hypothetical protein A2686_01790 [Candidatus Woesebacteria bacterium RIFCSPHIGHO2_01_FULL_38_10]|uniref:Uncharacterized protein n=1 Tax=Candidatus Woesebacteria bacterium RIFCSPLOWO2_01_FULL_39_10b TaxID=1802517 RepID=A0A1F8B649_9BACT|nr:MAG: hypothetical protein A2686_01790 [Candidatus Woesebacteria bacterium RIFCSPHIGHO2_01_FULL_38_10]OGM59516.1 MAG: hypothetical protein A2892_02680 [Candidatus Woesebacteria bacterium RIFCSPLOWO2_01_FULL_39_10b]